MSTNCVKTKEYGFNDVAELLRQDVRDAIRACMSAIIDENDSIINQDFIYQADSCRKLWVPADVFHFVLDPIRPDNFW